jgi:UDP-N-acetylglucosamine transferase subunit ALG13
MQIGRSMFEANHAETFPFKSKEEAEAYYEESRLVVCHAGVGSILGGMTRNKPLVLIPRTVLVSDSNDDQQAIVAEKVRRMGRGVVVGDISELCDKIREAGSLEFPPYVKSTALSDFVADLLLRISKGERPGKGRRRLKNKSPPSEIIWIEKESPS